jgi:GTP-dependent phosphoenolpyruvate carboxykinase
VDPKLWREEFKGIAQYFAQFGDRVPAPLKAELKSALERVDAS